MKNEIYIESNSPDGNHYCIIESDERSVWMYLHDIKEKRVIATAPICSRLKLMKLSDLKKLYKGQGAPPLVSGYSNESAVIEDIANQRLNILWHIDGVSPLALLDDEPVSMIIKGEKRGYSKAIKVDGPWGHPWDDDLYTKMMG